MDGRHTMPHHKRQVKVCGYALASCALESMTTVVLNDDAYLCIILMNQSDTALLHLCIHEIKFMPFFCHSIPLHVHIHTT